jgi:Cofilin/tropomyosin-type actin-binding protein
MNLDLLSSDSFTIIKARKSLLRVIPFLRMADIVFIYSCPASSSIKQRTLYASSKSAILSIAAELGVKIDTKIETSEVDELKLDYFSREVHGADIVEEKKTFARPRGPQRRVRKADNTDSNVESGTE